MKRYKGLGNKRQDK